MRKITQSGEIGGVTHVKITDAKQSEGVIHVIGKALLPKAGQ